MRVVVANDTVVVVMSMREAINLGNDIDYAEELLDGWKRLPLEPETSNLSKELLSLEWIHS